MRLPLAAKIALARAGATGGTPGSPTPPSGLSNAGRVDEMRADLRRRGVDAGQLVAVEVGLLGAAVLEADLAQGREADALHDGAFELRAHAIGIDHGAAIEGDVDARDRELALGADRHLGDDTRRS